MSDVQMKHLLKALRDVAEYEGRPALDDFGDVADLAEQYAEEEADDGRLIETLKAAPLCPPGHIAVPRELLERAVFLLGQHRDNVGSGMSIDVHEKLRALLKQNGGGK